MGGMTKNILIIDKDIKKRDLLRKGLPSCYSIYHKTSLQAAFQFLSTKLINMIILGEVQEDHFKCLMIMKKKNLSIGIILLMPYPKNKDSIKVQELGIVDYISEDELLFRPEAVANIVFKAFEMQQLKKINLALLEEQKNSHGSFFIPENSIYQDIYLRLKKVIDAGFSILLMGETGSGKDALIRQLCYQFMPHKPLITIDCGAICETLSESELFGYEAGAFTDAKYSKMGKLELANNGILFLDEIGNMPLQIQQNLLRVIEDKNIFKIGSEKITPIDFQFVAATNHNLKKAVALKTFREDLYYRISQFIIEIPPIRHYPDALRAWIFFFVNQFKTKYQTSFKKEQKQIEAWMAYPWRGNIRELKHEIERCLFLESIGESPGSMRIPIDSDYQEPISLKEMEKRFITKIISDCNYNISQASKKLCIPRTTLISKLKKHKIQNTDNKNAYNKKNNLNQH